MDFVAEGPGGIELYEAKWTELPADRDAVNLTFVRGAIGAKRVASASIVSRTPNAFPMSDGVHALGVEALAVNARRA